MNRLLPPFSVLLALFSLLSAVAADNSGTRREALVSKPNIVFILSDDVGIADLGCYGQEMFATPNIDRMAAEGICLSHHYSGASVCAPSRASLLTGLHTGHVSVRSYKPDQLLLESDVTVAEKLKEAGYVTGAIGKWGLGHPPPLDDPYRKGFDEFYGYINTWHAHNFFPEFLYRNGVKEILPGNRLKDMQIAGITPSQEGAGLAEVRETYVHDLFDREALSFIEKHRNEPFFLYLAYNAVHANNEAGHILGDGMEVVNYGEFAEKDWPNPEKGFAQMMRNLDNSVGLIREKLKKLGIAERTLVIFASDNGPHAEGGHKVDFFDSNGPYRGLKRDLYDGGLRTPFIAWWPGKIPAGASSNHVSAFWDFMPTACELAGVDAPEDTDGISMVPTLLQGGEGQKTHRYLYWEYYAQGGRQAVLKDGFKAVRQNVRLGGNVPTELYDTRKDVSEQTDIASQHPELVKQMEALMLEAHRPLPFMSLFNNDVSAD